MRKLYTNIILFVLLLITTNVIGQSNLMYYMNNVPQSYQVNPATQPMCNFFMGGYSTFSIGNTAVSPSDLFWYDADLDSVVNPFTSGAHLDKFLGKLNNTEQFYGEGNINFLSFGFRSGQMYFCFDATLKNSQHLMYPKSLVEFILQGDENNRVYDFSDLNFEFLSYAELSVNISRKFGEMLSIGVRPKILYGLATITTQENDITLATSTDEFVLDAHSAVRMAATGLPLPVDENGLFDPQGSFEYDSTTTVSDIISSINKNRGFGVDIGIHFQPIEQVQFSASLLDLGYIQWADKPQSIILDGSYTFRGVNIGLADSIDKFDQILDTLKENLSASGSATAFKTTLNPKLIAGGRIFLTPKIDVGLLSRTEFNPKEVDQDFILLADFRPFRGLSFSASYSMLGKGRSTIGFGWGIKIGPSNSFFISEYNPFRYDRLTESGKPYNFEAPAVELGSRTLNPRFPGIIPVDIYKLSFRIGTNIVFGCNKAKKLRRDTPMFNSTDWMY
jgi:hypothetical protein